MKRSRMLVLGLLAALLLNLRVARAAEPVYEAGRHGRGSLNYVQGIPVLELAGTPERVARFYEEVFSGTDPSVELDLATFPHRGGDDLVLVRDIPFHSTCVHHFAPFFGRALVAYLPDP